MVFFAFALCLYQGRNVQSNTEVGVQGTSSEEGGFSRVPVKSFASFKKSKGKEWKSRVTKSTKEENKKTQDAVIHVGSMEWNEKDQALKARRGKRLPLRVSQNGHYIAIRKQAEEKWKTFNSNFYDESQSYHLLYEDGRKALFLPGSKKEPFSLGRYQEEIGKDFKRITLYLCRDYDFQVSEGNFDEDDLDDFSTTKRQKCDIDLTCKSDPQTSTKHDQLEFEHDQDQLFERVNHDQSKQSESAVSSQSVSWISRLSKINSWPVIFSEFMMRRRLALFLKMTTA